MADQIVDLRSDTVTRPDDGMRRAMAQAEVGDDVYREDPTVIALENRVAELAGMQTGLFMPSGTQSNLVALMTHCGRGDEYIVGQEAHTYAYEGGGGAVLGGIQPQPLENEPDGTIPLEKIRRAIKADDIHFAKTRLIALENTLGGRVISEGYFTEVAVLATKSSLSMHLDGARVFNAAVATQRPVASICEHFDSVSICLSKGLGTPAGSVLCGEDAFIARARRWRKMVGGGMRQAGILAAAGLYALEHNIDRLNEDHAHAKRLASGLSSIPVLVIHPPQTNMLYVELPEKDLGPLGAHLIQRGVRATLRPRTRLVTHLDIDVAAIERTIEAFRAFYHSRD